MPLPAGSVIADRFTIETVAGSGGMGTVYRAVDQSTGQPVALKLLHREISAARSTERFAREAELLAQLTHPNIVAYVAHGETADGLRYLAMQWLAGQDLAQRLAGGRLTLRDSVACLTAVAGALETLHRRGIVHRDLKPGNLLLPEGKIERATLLDFGIAKQGLPEPLADPPSTPSASPHEAALGTPLYMAPEQARGEHDIGPSADIFSLGCVLYECLTGRPPFTAAHQLAVLARILFAEALPATVLRPGIPPALAALLDKMLAKQPGRRPPDGGALLKELQALGDLIEDEPAPALPLLAGRWPSGTEQQLVCVMVATPAPAKAQPGAAADAERRRQLAALVGQFAGRSEWLRDGSLVVTMEGLKLHSAINLAYQAAQCALAIIGHGGIEQLTLATCRAVGGSHVPLGGVIDAAVGLLANHRHRPSAAGTIFLDRLSAVLLARHFVVTTEAEIAALGPKLQEGDDRLTGAKGIFLGRDSELGALEAFWNTAVEESKPALAVVTGPSGSGKTRLWQEFAARLRTIGEPLTVLAGSGDPIQASTPYGLVQQALRELGAPPQQSRLLQQLRQGQQTDHEALQQLFLQQLRAAASKAPVLLVLDGIQWADALSLTTIGRALKQLAKSPLFVLVLGPSRLPAASLWPEQGRNEILLKGLSKRACERLIQQKLGQPLAPAVMTRLVELSGGNPLFLEVLMRLAATEKPEQEAEAVSAMLQARFSALPAAVRRVLLAASLFGLTFCRGELQRFLGEEEETELDAALRTLEETELIDRSSLTQSAQEARYRFRHALIRDAASGLLGEHDRSVGERLVAELRRAAQTMPAP